MKTRPVMAVCLGDPQGIGPEIVQKSLDDPEIQSLADWKIFGKGRHPIALTPKECGAYSWEALESATLSIKSGECHGLVTAPVSKFRLSEAGFPYRGQTEFLSSTFRIQNVAMMIATPVLKVVLVTIHIPLLQLTRYWNAQKILETILLTNESMRTNFGIPHPSIAVCGLNPHAGERGLFGTEEGEIIVPALEQAQAKGMTVSGPHSPDSVFFQASQGRFDVVICHYHDQGLIAAKTLHFHEGVNITLGLPIVRTSPDQGCAFDLAGSGRADPSSMKCAMRLAVDIWHQRQR